MNNRCYISGKITDEPYHEFYFHNAAYLVREMGFNPVSHLRKMRLPYWVHITLDIALLVTCPYVYFIRNWTNSKGARIEHYIAMILQKRIMYE